MNLTVEVHATRPSAEIAQIEDALHRYNVAHFGNDDATPVVVLLRDETGHLYGGLVGTTYWQWLAIDLLWIDDALRGRGYGSQLLHTAETVARQRGCHSAHLDTFSFQAPAFYQQHGYEIYGTLDNYTAGQQRLYLRKRLLTQTQHEE
ncbi:MAG: GNAT family N-acetyltransferase [Anaerolineales bacterium]|nr:GNAT family N-acetyltransferase [Anaerolineales bacterium]